MYTSDGNRIRSLEHQIGEQQKLSWAMLLTGLAAGFVGMYFIVARPMAREMRSMKIEIAQMHQQMELLGAQGDQVWEANSLLSSLKTQQSQLEDARQSLQSMKQLRTEVIEVADQARLSLTQLKAMTQLNNRIIQEQPSVEIAGRVLDDVSQLQQRLANRKDATQTASQALDQIIDLEDDLCAQTPRLEETRTAMRQMMSLHDELRRGTAHLDAAWFGLQGLVILKESLMSGAQHVEVAQIIGDQLLAMQEKFAGQASESETAASRVRQLLDMNAALLHSDVDLQTSRNNLKSLLELQQTIRDLPSLAQAMESLDLLIAFQDEFIDQVQVLGEMRKSLVELAVMETTVAKVVRSLEPLLALVDLRRMSDDEIRSAARNILEERTTRLTGRTRRDRAGYEANSVKDAFVPEPTNEE